MRRYSTLLPTLLMAWPLVVAPLEAQEPEPLGAEIVVT